MVEITKKELKMSDKITGSKYFTWAEALLLPRLNSYAAITEEQKNNIIKTAKVMDKIREFLNAPVLINVWFRTPEYNALIGGAKKSKHLDGLAVDFHVDSNVKDEVEKLKSKLEEFDIRMEQIEIKDANNVVTGYRNWIHIDLGEPGPSGRYFRPS